MGQFLRDETIENINISEQSITRIGNLFIKRAQELNASLPENAPDEKKQVVELIIRYDGKGYRFYQIEDLLECFRIAKSVERIVISMESQETISLGGEAGTRLMVRFDALQPDTCRLIVTDDNSDWVAASYSMLHEILGSMKNNSGLIRNSWTPFAIQIVGVVVGFIASLLVAIKLTPNIKVESAFVVSFIFVFLVFSNIWSYLNPQIQRFIYYIFPNINFKRFGKERLNWLGQNLIGGILLLLAVYFLSELFGFVGTVLEEYVLK